MERKKFETAKTSVAAQNPASSSAPTYAGSSVPDAFVMNVVVNMAECACSSAANYTRKKMRGKTVEEKKKEHKQIGAIAALALVKSVRPGVSADVLVLLAGVEKAVIWRLAGNSSKANDTTKKPATTATTTMAPLYYKPQSIHTNMRANQRRSPWRKGRRPAAPVTAAAVCATAVREAYSKMAARVFLKKSVPTSFIK